MFKGSVFTTGQVARICSVTPATVNKWFDKEGLRGYRLPGSQDRRIPRQYLVEFLKTHDMPLGELAEKPAIENDWYLWINLPEEFKVIITADKRFGNSVVAANVLVCSCGPEVLGLDVLPQPVIAALGGAYDKLIAINSGEDGLRLLVWFNVVGVTL